MLKPNQILIVLIVLLTAIILSSALINTWLTHNSNESNTDSDLLGVKSGNSQSSTNNTPPGTSVQTRFPNHIPPTRNSDSAWRKQLEQTSMGDTSPPAFFKFENGDLIPSESLKAIFDYFLALDGELSLDQIRQILLNYANTELTEAQSAQALSAFDQYFDYLESIHAFQKTLDSTLTLQERYQWIKSQRRQILGDELTQSYFQYEEIYDEFSLAKFDIINDTNLTHVEKQRAIEQLHQQLPKELMAREQQDIAIQQAIKNDREQRDKLTQNDIYQQRLQHFGFETTQRLTDLDSDRQAWQERYDQYAIEAESIRSSDLAIMDKHTAIEQLRQRHFNGPELVRVAALDKIAKYQ